MPGYNHFSNCGCGWCIKYSTGRRTGWFDGNAANARVMLGERQFREGSFSSCFVMPNASCPVCGAAVFFYQNAHGSRVFFDELGHPWPKHACTDRGRNYEVRVPSQSYVGFARRSFVEIEEILDFLREAKIDPRSLHAQKYGQDPESVCRTASIKRSGFLNALQAVELVGGHEENIYIKFTSANYIPNVGEIFSTDGQTISFPDSNKRFKADFISSIEFLEMKYD